MTLFEKRVAEEDLPFFMAFMAHLSSQGVAAPAPIADLDGRIVKSLCGRPAAIISFLDGGGVKTPTLSDCQEAGAACATLHLAAEGFNETRANALSLDGWRELVAACRADADRCAAGLADFVEAELRFLRETWPTNLPTGVVHADLFPDNIFFQDGRFSGVIDFYFSCTDYYAYDLAILLCAWVGEFGWDAAKAAALLNAYEARRPLTRAERAALPILLRGGALRFLLTRLYDWIHQVDGAQVRVKDPLAYRDLLVALQDPSTNLGIKHD